MVKSLIGRNTISNDMTIEDDLEVGDEITCKSLNVTNTGGSNIVRLTGGSSSLTELHLLEDAASDTGLRINYSGSGNTWGIGDINSGTLSTAISSSVGGSSVTIHRGLNMSGNSILSTASITPSSNNVSSIGSNSLNYLNGYFSNLHTTNLNCQNLSGDSVSIFRGDNGDTAQILMIENDEGDASNYYGGYIEYDGNNAHNSLNIGTVAWNGTSNQFTRAMWINRGTEHVRFEADVFIYDDCIVSDVCEVQGLTRCLGGISLTGNISSSANTSSNIGTSSVRFGTIYPTDIHLPTYGSLMSALSNIFTRLNTLDSQTYPPP